MPRVSMATSGAISISVAILFLTCRSLLRQIAARCSTVQQVESMTSKHRITVNLSEVEYAELGKLADKSNVSLAWLGRHAINSLIERAQNDEDQTPLPLSRSLRRGTQ